MSPLPQPHANGPFRPGAFAIVTLANPREKVWGVILELSVHGLSMRGIDLAAFEDLVASIKTGDPFTSGVVFFPMHRVERVELDLPEGGIPSMCQRFEEKTGKRAEQVLAADSTPPDAETVRR